MDIIVSVFINNKNKNENIKDFHSFCKGKRINFKDNFGKDFNDNLKDKKRDFNDNFNNITVSLFTGIENNISIYIVEVPNETAPSIQGFAKPPA